MLNTEDIIAKIIGLIVDDNEEQEPIISGLGICTDTKIDYSKEKIERSKEEIASILRELGVDEQVTISLRDLMKLKNGECWNYLQNYNDFKALELLLSCASACDFIINDNETVAKNINQLENNINESSILIFGTCRNTYLFDKPEEWLNFIRQYVIDNMCFMVKKEEIKKYTEDDTNKVIR